MTPASPMGLGVAAAILSTSTAFAGPPYVTDDPEPVEYRHWELYLASMDEHDADGWAGTSPHVEVNYGVVPDLQLHLIAPVAFDVPKGERARFGPGDTELGAKWRFVHETSVVPQIGIFPLLEAPTGSARRGLGNGAVQAFLPLWVQKTLGRWTSYGGGGVWLNAAPGARPWGYVGWQLQRQVIDRLALGAELFYETPKTPGGAEVRFNVGAILDVTDEHHVLVSAGRGLMGPNLFQAYLAWLVTLGPSAN